MTEQRKTELAIMALDAELGKLGTEITRLLAVQAGMIQDLITFRAELSPQSVAHMATLEDGQVQIKITEGDPEVQTPAPKKHRKFSKAARKRMSEAQKIRYAKQRGEVPAVEPPAKKRKRKRS